MTNWMVLHNTPDPLMSLKTTNYVFTIHQTLIKSLYKKISKKKSSPLMATFVSEINGLHQSE